VAFDIKQSLKLTQQLLMTPQLQQAIKLLQLSRVELEEFVAQQLAENPVLEEGVTSSHEEKVQVERERETSESQVVNDHMGEAANIMDKVSKDQPNEVDWESYSKHQESAAPIPSSAVRRDEEFPNYENIVTKGKTLTEFLMAQIGELEFAPEEKRIAEVIIGNIDDRGYLRSTVEEIAEMEGFTIDAIEDCLDSIQRLEPPGVGARDLKECLLIQLRNERLKNGIVEKIIEHHLKDLETRNYQAIVKALKIPMEKVIENVQIIAELEPVPGRQYGQDAAQYIVPDVYVFKIGDEWVVGMNEDGLPRLQISKIYKDILDKGEKSLKDGKAQDKQDRIDEKAGKAHVEKTEKEKSDKGIKVAEKEYISDKLKSAEWLIKSIQQRQRTIFKVTECIVKRQVEFFNQGVEHLKPMILKDIAEDIEMHESTISRVTTNKYVHTPRGIFELKYFFNSSVTRADGENMASESVKRMISDLIKTETPKKPFSDQKIVEVLEEKGIQLARRTVAKYREQMGILPSSKRKKYF
jgi:RNA polymerase sigma-54 factor